MSLQRRRLLALAAGAVALPARAAGAADPPLGWAQPRPQAPATLLRCADGRRRPLRELLAGRVSAVQLMFTGCNGSCPPQGILFASVASSLPPLPGLQLLSISVDALGDDPQTLADWQGRFGRNPAWLAGVPAVSDVDPVAGFLRGVPAAGIAHTAQVFVFDRQARLAYRTGDAPPAAMVRALLQHVAQNAG